MSAPLPFRKMHGLGNDFAVFDARISPLPLTPAQARAIADRRRGIGCDQVIVIEPSPRADAFMRIYNADGGEVASCGNASRCVALLLAQEKGTPEVTIETLGGLLSARAEGEDRVTVDMGAPRLGWREIPLASECDTLHVPLSEGVLSDPVALSMGNPHAVFFVPDAASVPLQTLGPKLERHPLFPERANIGVAEVSGANALRLRVWERGAGETQACGTGACAAAVAAIRRGLLAGPEVTVDLPGGRLSIHWREGETVRMTGPAETSYTGEWKI